MSVHLWKTTQTCFNGRLPRLEESINPPCDSRLIEQCSELQHI